MSKLPKFFKDASDFCYVATPILAKKPGLTPWDGAVNAQGFAVADTPKQQRTRRQTTQAETDSGNAE